MGIALFQFVGGQYIVEDCDQAVVVGQIGTASCTAYGCWNEDDDEVLMHAGRRQKNTNCAT